MVEWAINSDRSIPKPLCLIASLFHGAPALTNDRKVYLTQCFSKCSLEILEFPHYSFPRDSWNYFMYSNSFILWRHDLLLSIYFFHWYTVEFLEITLIESAVWLGVLVQMHISLAWGCTPMNPEMHLVYLSSWIIAQPWLHALMIMWWTESHSSLPLSTIVRKCHPTYCSFGKNNIQTWGIVSTVLYDFPIIMKAKQAKPLLVGGCLYKLLSSQFALPICYALTV